MLISYVLSFFGIYYLTYVGTLTLAKDVVGIVGNSHLSDVDTFHCSQPPPEYFRCPLPNGLFPHPKNCSLYYMCTNDCAIQKECNSPARFNSLKNACEDMSDEFCAKPPLPLKGDIFEGIDDRYHCPRDGVFRHDSSCEKYYSCMNAVPYVYSCRNKLFDERYLSCNWPHLTPCGERVRPEGVLDFTPPDFQCRNSNASYLQRDPFDCKSFYFCNHGVVEGKIQCTSDELVFDQELQTCNYKSNVNCSSLMDY